jgi:hypothetical protein
MPTPTDRQTVTQEFSLNGADPPSTLVIPFPFQRYLPHPQRLQKKFRFAHLVERVPDDLDVKLREVGAIAAELLLRVARCSPDTPR